MEIGPDKQSYAENKNWQLGAYLVMLPFILVFLLIGLWPSGIKDDLWATFLLKSVAPDVGLLLIIAMAGALGGSLNASYKFAIHKGLGQFNDSWNWWYVMHPVFGMGLGLLVCLLFKGGLFAVGTAGDKTAAVDPTGLAALSALVGMFARKGIAKLDELFDTLLKAPKVQEEIEALPPVIDSVEPSNKKINDTDKGILVKGRNFAARATVEIDGKAVVHKVMDDGRLQVMLEDGQLASARKVPVVVINPAGNGGRSKPAHVEVTE
ncbi:hypothetical protein J5J10_05720 [Ciceribacter sp. L1K23]|uniref:hypothetical protein n=1 Tax=Ciceribacter sp. L1K23 TaxID=2820276 RepID=UPI001B845363|nr:hypothetical protein [Ciceribacter sp. L1K23]MBR0555175.1 hypothetical protein [Ciceribacter sp. L1K23]